MTVDEACSAYLRELGARNMRQSTLENYRSLFNQLRAFAADARIESIEAIDRAAMEGWRESWDCAYSTQRRRLAQLKAFFSHAAAAGWVPVSPVSGIRSPKSDARPTMPLSIDEVRAMIDAARANPKEQALILLLRYSGLAMRDAATLAYSALQSTGEVILRRAKSGEVVTVPLPAEALAALHGIAEPGRRHFFWTGRSAGTTVAKYWRGRLKTIATAARVEDFHPHRLRDTFAVELLLSGMSMEDVSILLGHSSVRTTEKYYAPWNYARRRRLIALVHEVHRQDPILREFTPKKPAGTAPPVPAEASLATRDVPEPTLRVQGST
ncbi:MAG: tyrosine-type recombinase/integrase [Bryobacterales bacterium]|nr:tyrosine-type recombinase/integrase [Bryobacterales bacterium]